MLNINAVLLVNAGSMPIQMPRFTYCHFHRGLMPIPISLWWLLEQYGEPIGGRIDDNCLALSIREGAFVVQYRVANNKAWLFISPTLRQRLGWEEDVAVELELISNAHQHPEIRLRRCNE